MNNSKNEFAKFAAEIKRKETEAVSAFRNAIVNLGVYSRQLTKKIRQAKTRRVN